jgi:hypothetical protein
MDVRENQLKLLEKLVRFFVADDSFTTQSQESPSRVGMA